MNNSVHENRSAKEIIDQVIKENRFPEWVMYGCAIVLVICGVSILIMGALNDAPFTSFSGAVATSLFYPPINLARQIRKENIAIRLLEAPLSRADTAKAAADSIRQFVAELLLDCKELRAQ